MMGRDMPENTPLKRLPEIRSLTAVRFYAALAVVLFHYGQHAFKDAPQWMRNIVSGGSHGVALFFILSGFILVYVTQSVDVTTPNQRRRFYLRRFARIYPVYFLAWLMVGTFFVEEWVRTGTSLLFAAKVVATYGSLSALLLQGWVPTAASVWNWPGWTLSTEAFFYASFPFALPVFLRMRTATLLLWLLACLTANIVVVEGLSLMSSHSRTIAAGTNFEVTWSEFLGTVPLLHFPQFLAGVVLGVIFTRRKAPVFFVRHHLAILIVTVLAIGGGVRRAKPRIFFPASRYSDALVYRIDLDLGDLPRRCTA